MSLRLLFWILMLLWLIFGVAWNALGVYVGHYGPLGNNILLFALFATLGWRVFGKPIEN